MNKKRLLTGDRPTGRMHLGHYVGSIANRVKLQDEYDCFFIIADLHMLTTRPDRADIDAIRTNAVGMVIDYLSCGIDPAKMIPGTGLSNIADTARLSRACLDLGCAGVMTLPPFYFKTVTEDGIYRYFAHLIDVLGLGARIFLYHIPPIAIVGIPPTLAARLHSDFPNQIVGIKDSSGDWDNTQTLLKIEGMIVFPGSELPLIDALALGGPGCISATANLNAGNIARVIDMYEKGEVDGARALHETVKRFRLLVQDYGPIPAQKRLLAIATGDARWANVRPPLTTMSEKAGRELAAILKRDFEFELAYA